MQQDHASLLVNIEKNASDPVLGQARSHFKDSVPQRSTNGHSDWPSKLDRFDILSDAFSVLWRELFQPHPYWFSAGLCPIENGRDPFSLIPGIGRRFRLIHVL